MGQIQGGTGVDPESTSKDQELFGNFGYSLQKLEN